MANPRPRVIQHETTYLQFYSVEALDLFFRSYRQVYVSLRCYDSQTEERLLNYPESIEAWDQARD